MYKYICAALLAISLSGCAAMAPPTGPQLTQNMVDTYLGFQAKWEIMSTSEQNTACSNIDLVSPTYVVYRLFLKDVCV